MEGCYSCYLLNFLLIASVEIDVRQLTPYNKGLAHFPYGGAMVSTEVDDSLSCVSRAPMAGLKIGKNVIANDNDYAPQALAA